MVCLQCDWVCMTTTCSGPPAVYVQAPAVCGGCSIMYALWPSGCEHADHVFYMRMCHAALAIVTCSFVHICACAMRHLLLLPVHLHVLISPVCPACQPASLSRSLFAASIVYAVAGLWRASQQLFGISKKDFATHGLGV